MTDRRKRNILIWTLALLVLVFGCLVFFDGLFGKKSGQKDDVVPAAEINETGNHEKPGATDPEEETIRISWRDYTVYDLGDPDFRFIIASVRVSADGPTNLSLKHFVTEEGITLDHTQEYVRLLEEKSLYLGRQNVCFSLISEDASYTANVFIPVKDDALASLTVSCDIPGTREMKFQLVNAEGKREALEYHADDVITDGETYQMRVSAAYDITGQPLYKTENGTESEYLLPSTTKVYAFKVEAVSLWGDEIIIESAEYVPDTTGEVFTALPSSVRSLKNDNILGKSVTDKDSGFLFFYAYDPDDHPVTYRGVLKLKVRGYDQPVSVIVNLN